MFFYWEGGGRRLKKVKRENLRFMDMQKENEYMDCMLDDIKLNWAKLESKFLGDKGKALYFADS